MVRALADGIAAAFEAGDTTTARVGIDALRALVDVAARESSDDNPNPEERVPTEQYCRDDQQAEGCPMTADWGW